MPGWFDSIVGQTLTVNPASTEAALAMELLRREVAALKTLTDKTAVTRENALERAITLAGASFWHPAAKEEVIGIASEVFGISVGELRQQVEQARIERATKTKADMQAKAAKAVSVTMPAVPVPGTPACSNGQAAAMESDKLPPIESAEDLINDASASPPPEIIQGLLHQGSKAVLASGSKARKTWILMDLALCVSSGSPFWDLPTVQGRVLYINFEIQRAFFKSRLVKLCEARGIQERRNFDVWNLRGHAAHLGILMPKIIERVKQRGYSVILVDPIYKGLGGRDENSAGDMGQLCNELEALSVQTGAAVVFAAHFTKGNQAGKNAMDRISGSGVVARDADTIITLTQHDVPGAYTVESTLRNFPEPDPFVVGWAFPLMVRRSDLDPAKLKQANGRKPTYAVADVLTLIQSTPLSTMDWCKAAEKQLGLSKRTFLRLKKEALDEGAITPASNDTWTLAGSPAQGATGAKSTI